jgi:protein-disulfide isomerase
MIVVTRGRTSAMRRASSDDNAIAAVLAERQEGEAKYGVDPTPTIIINLRKIKGAQTVEQLAD